MIVRHIPMKAIRQSSFAGLVRYITSEQGKQERLGEVHITNCQNHELNWATHEINATQCQNQRAQGDKTYHLLISFPAGETPTAAMLNDIEARVCASIGFSEHQRISAIHYDTDNLHIHVAINKIHPTRFTLHEPFRAYKVLGEVAALLEIKHGLQKVNHLAGKVGSENRAQDMEHHAGVESLLGWIKRECLEPIQNAQSWSGIHQVLQNHGLEMRERGNGLIITDGSGVAVKASSVSRDFSKNKLEKRHGAFEKRVSRRPAASVFVKRPGIGRVGCKPPQRRLHHLHALGHLDSLSIDCGPRYMPRPVAMKIHTGQLYARYQDEHRHATTSRAREWATARTKKNRLIEKAKRSARLKRAAIKMMQGSTANKKVLYAFTSQTLKTEIDQVNADYLKERAIIYKKYQRCAWADWLKSKAMEGEVEALTILRSREARQRLKGNVLTGFMNPDFTPEADLSPDNITKTGVIIYRVGSCAIRDDGDALKVSRGSSEEGLRAALTMAMKRYGQCLTVKGSEPFREQIAQLAALMKLPITFDDEALEARRQTLIKTPIIPEKNHEYQRPADHERRRTNRGGDESPGTVESTEFIRGPRRARDRKPDVGRRPKPDLGRIGCHPPPLSKNRLRNLSQLGMVQLAGGSEVLLPGNVSRHLEQQGTQSDHGVRWPISGAGVKSLGSGVDSYIAEREFKRQTIADIPRHRRYQSGDDGAVEFSGLRQMNGETLALLKRDEEIIVLSIDAATARRLKRISIGHTLTLTSKAVVISKGRHR